MSAEDVIDKQWVQIFQLVDCIKYDDERQILGDGGDIAYKIRSDRALLKKALLTWMLAANYMGYMGIFGAIMELYNLYGFMQETEMRTP